MLIRAVTIKYNAISSFCSVVTSTKTKTLKSVPKESEIRLSKSVS